MKHIWISGMNLNLIEERHKVFQELNWVGNLPPAYSFHVFENKDNTKGIVACSDAFGGGLSWARYNGSNPMIGKEMPPFDGDEITFLHGRYPAFLEAVSTLDD